MPAQFIKAYMIAIITLYKVSFQAFFA